MPIDDIIKELKDNKDLIFGKLKKRENDVNKYFFIKNTYENGNTSEFQNTYKDFYKMNIAQLGDQFFKKYFELLDSKETDLKKILNELYEIQNRRGRKTLQFSFVTKLLHTINNKKPIYDKHTGEILGIKFNDRHLLLKERIEKRLEGYQKLEEKFEKLLDDETIKELIKDCRKELKCEKYDWSDKSISDLKVLDFILWVSNQKIKRIKELKK